MAVRFLDSWEVADDIGCARASRILRYFCVKLVNALFTGSRMKRTISPTRNLHFCGFFTASQPATAWFSHLFSHLVFTAALQLLPRTF